jgi:hypothetical protein
MVLDRLIRVCRHITCYICVILTIKNYVNASVSTGFWILSIVRNSKQIEYSMFRKLLFSWRMGSSWMLRCVDLVRTDVSEELSASFIRVTRIGELGTTIALTSNRPTLRRNTEGKETPTLLHPLEIANFNHRTFHRTIEISSSKGPN